jgi:hypothetical protein
VLSASKTHRIFSIGECLMDAEFQVGDRVRLIAQPPYVKTADPMPMLRPATVIALGETGIILDRRPGNYWSVRFAQGAYLLESRYLARLDPQS